MVRQPAPFSLCMAVYGQPQMMEVQFNNLRSFTSELRSLMEVVVVDDCGTPPLTPPTDLPVRVFRVDEDYPWNQMGARNLAAEKAKHEWLLLVDPDMVFSEPMLWRLLRTKVPTKTLVQPALRHKSTGRVDTSSPNIYFMRKTDFFNAGGYDEDFRGHKGWSDVSLMFVFRGLRYRYHRDPSIWAWFYSPEDVPDSMVKTLDRNLSRNRELHEKKILEMRRLGSMRYAEQRRSAPRCRFPYHEVDSLQASG